MNAFQSGESIHKFGISHLHNASLLSNLLKKSQAIAFRVVLLTVPLQSAKGHRHKITTNRQCRICLHTWLRELLPPTNKQPRKRHERNLHDAIIDRDRDCEVSNVSTPVLPCSIISFVVCPVTFLLLVF